MTIPIKFDFERYTPAIPAIPAISGGSLAATQCDFAGVQNSRIAGIAPIEPENNTIVWVEYIEPDADNPLSVICYTPNGKPILVLAKDERHKALLLKMNPSPRQQ